MNATGKQVREQVRGTIRSQNLAAAFNQTLFNQVLVNNKKLLVDNGFNNITILSANILIQNQLTYKYE